MVAMKMLMLMRHAEAGWTEPGMGDHDRALSENGRLGAAKMARWLASQPKQPDTVLCSSARRARETASVMREAVPALPEPEVSDALYHAEPATIMEHLRRLPDECDCVLLIGHEPGLGSLLRVLDGQASPEIRHACNHFSTAAIAVLAAAVDDWARVSAGNVRAVGFKTPGTEF